MNDELLRNPHRRHGPISFGSTRAPLQFHRKLPGYEATPLVSVPALADLLGVGRVLIKIESSRFGLPAFKILGASWATYCALTESLTTVPEWHTIDELATAFNPLRPISLAAATDGNHGRAVARMGNMLGFDVKIFVPGDMAAARINAIESEGAEIVIVDGTYDDAVEQSGREASERCVVISDTSWPGYVDTPRRVIDGYATMFVEIDDELERQGWPTPAAIFLPCGVGAFAAAGVAHYRNGIANTTLIAVEPLDAACVMESLRAGELVEVPGPHRSMMVGLNCGTPSLIALPALLDGLDFALKIGDNRSSQAMRLLAANSIIAGETGSASLAGALGVLELGGNSLLGLDGDATVLCIVTEGATDPIEYERIVATFA